MNKITLINVKDNKSKTHHLLMQYLFKNNVTNEYLVASSSKAHQDYGGFLINETMLFRASKNGTILDWSELDCHRPALETEEKVTQFVIQYWFPEMVEIFA